MYLLRCVLLMIVLRLCFALNAISIAPLTNSIVERQALGYFFPMYIHSIYTSEVTCLVFILYLCLFILDNVFKHDAQLHKHRSKTILSQVSNI